MAKPKPAAPVAVDKSSIKMQLQELRAEYDAKRREAEKKVIEPYLSQLETLKKERDDLDSKIYEIEKIIAEVTGKSMAPAGGAGGKRKRASKEELASMAGKIADFLRSKGAGGASAGEIREAVGHFAGSPAAMVKKFAGITIKSTGEKAATRYHL